MVVTTTKKTTRAQCEQHGNTNKYYIKKGKYDKWS